MPAPGAMFAPVAEYAHLGLAVSGGPDSLALMLVAARWAAGLRTPPRITVYTVDHGLRAEAVSETRFVAATAEKLGLEARVLEWKGRKPAAGVQAAARAARYRLIGQAMREDGAAVLLTAHHAGDQAETVLMRLAHGSGIGGIGGMDAFAEVEGVRIFRPFLGVAPEALALVVQQAGLAPVIDPSNSDTAYERVRWRKALPVLGALGLTSDRLGRFARRARRADAALERMAGEAFARIAMRDPFGAIAIEGADYAALAEELRVRVVQMALSRAGGGQRPFDLGRVEALAEALALPDFARRTLNGAIVMRRAGRLVLAREAGRIEKAPQIVDPGGTMIWDNRFCIDNGTVDGVRVSPAGDWSRKDAERVLGQPVTSPMVAVRAAPVVRSANGDVMAVGTKVLDSSISVAFAANGVA